jgi:hypothetical protein
MGSRVVSERLLRDWTTVGEDPAWIQWRRRDASGSAQFKLYVSPTLRDLPEVFGATVAALGRVACPGFKVGADAFGLLRPDKFVAYFSSLEALQAAAAAIQGGVNGVEVQGVPFTGVIDAAGLTSWGMDPPGEAWPASSRHSWRQWIVERLAVYLVAAKESGSPSPAEVAVRRLALDGMDTETWTPSLAIWSEHHAMEAEP